MALTGQLTSPDIKMSLELPNERDEVQALVRNYIPTDEQMNMQILYLLGIGKFYTPENVDATGNSNMMSSVLSSTLSGQLNNALSQIIDSNNWNFGTNFSTGEKGWTDMEFETMLSGQLLNNRLLINGNFGYRDNPMANTNFVGDFQAEWLVNRSGNIRLKAYNETNDRYYTKTNLTTQGIGIIFKKDFNKWNELLFWNKWKLKRLKRKQVKEDTSARTASPEEIPPGSTIQTGKEGISACFFFLKIPFRFFPHGNQIQTDGLFAPNRPSVCAIRTICFTPADHAFYPILSYFWHEQHSGHPGVHL